MLTHVHFISQHHAERLDGRPDVIVVSIHDRHTRPNLRNGFRDVLRLCFDDHDRERDGVDALQDAFTPEHAETLKSWLEPYLRAGMNFTLLVHCHAGISRSAAVAWWAHKVHGLEIRTDYPLWHLNRHVLLTLDSTIAPPLKPEGVPVTPRDRAFEPMPMIGPAVPHKALVVFCHGKESGPWGTKIRHLAHIARRNGAEVLSLDYRDQADPDRRVAQLLDAILPAHDRLILVGSSMGGYVATIASVALKPRGLFLMAPAFGMPGYAEQYPAPGTDHVCVIHGWQDEIIPVDRTMRFAQAHLAELHLIEADHRLNSVLPTVGRLFEDFLQRVLASDLA